MGVIAKLAGKATQRGLRLTRKGDIQLGDESPTERAIQDEIDTAKVAKGSRKPSVTQGKSSVAKHVVNKTMRLLG